MSLYSEYVNERTTDQIIEDDFGFITWRYLNEHEVYIIDIYVKPEHRKMGLAAGMADQVVKQAKEKGCSVLIGTVVPNTKNSDSSLKVLQGYGLELFSARENLIILKKDI